MNSRSTPNVFAVGLQFPEGPVAGPDGLLYVSELAAGRIRTIKADGTLDVFAKPGGGPNGMARGADGALYLANNGGIAWKDGKVDLSAPPAGHARIERVGPDGSVTELYTHVAGQPLSRASDMAIDAAGMIWFTDPGHGPLKSPAGGIFRAAPDGSVIEQVAAECVFPNGLAFTPDGSQLLVSETGAGTVFSYDVTAGASLIGKREFARLPDGYYPDGLCLDEQGNCLVAGSFGGGVIVFDAGGGMVETIELTDPLTTNVAFGGPAYDELFITQARTGSVLRLSWHCAGLRLPFDSAVAR